MDLQPIFIDVFQNDLNGKPKWDVAAADVRINGAILKVSEGRGASPAAWLRTNWSAIHNVERAVGVDWFCGGYHYLVFADDPVAQADLYLSTLATAGGLTATDLWPIVDVENADNPGATKQKVIDVTSAFAARIESETGRKPMLYGGSLMRDLNILDRMGCGWLWTARYAATLSAAAIKALGWDEDSLWGWQYQGTGADNVGRLAGFPTSIAGFAGVADVDLTVMVTDGGLERLATLLGQ